MKKLMKLVPAFIMLLVSAILVSTATFAWFSMNTQVTATGMNVEATSDGSLYISNAADRPAYQNIVAGTVNLADANATELKPTSTKDFSNWYKVAAERADQYKKAGSSTFELLTSPEGTYYLKKTVWLRSESNFSSLDVTGVNMTITAGTAFDDLGKALTVGFKVVDYKPTETTDPAVAVTTDGTLRFVAHEAVSDRHGAVKSTAADENTSIENITFVQDTNVNSTTGKQTIWTNSDPTTLNVANYVFQVEIYVYFDGQSASCYSNALTNAITLAGEVDVTFSVTAA